jgi:hypothetical protein
MFVLLGFCANKATTTFMNHETGKILHLEFGDSREVGRHSPRLEGHLTERGLHFLRDSGVRIIEVVSDASRTLISLMGKTSTR